MIERIETMSDLAAFWNSVPPVTKTVVTASVGTSLLVRLNVLPWAQLVYLPRLVFTRGQVWRLLTPFLAWPFGFGFLITMFFLYRHLRQLEEEEFRGRRADLLWMLVLLAGGVLLAGIPARLLLLGEPLLMAILYVWSRKYPGVDMTFMFGLRFKSQYLVWVLTAYHFILGSPVWGDAIGILCGHLYWFAADVLPRTHGLHLVRAPPLLQRLVPNTGVAGVQYMNGEFEAHAPPQRWQQDNQQQNQQGAYRRHNWGAGQRLGEM